MWTLPCEQRIGPLRLEQRSSRRDLDERTELAVARADRRDRLFVSSTDDHLAPRATVPRARAPSVRGA